MPGVGVEPTRKYKFRGILSPLCLPISPPGQTLAGGAFQSRTELYEFAIRCITALLTRHTLERETRFELATLTMARLCSTNWAIPASNVCHYTERIFQIKNWQKIFLKLWLLIPKIRWQKTATTIFLSFTFFW